MYPSGSAGRALSVFLTFVSQGFFGRGPILVRAHVSLGRRCSMGLQEVLSCWEMIFPNCLVASRGRKDLVVQAGDTFSSWIWDRLHFVEITLLSQRDRKCLSFPDYDSSLE